MPPMMTLRLQKQWRAEMASTCFMPLLVCLLSRMYSQRENWWCRLTYGIGVKHTHRKTLHVLQHDSGAAGTLSVNIWESQCVLALRKSWTQQDVGVPAFFFFFFASMVVSNQWCTASFLLLRYCQSTHWVPISMIGLSFGKEKHSLVHHPYMLPISQLGHSVPRCLFVNMRL